MDHARALRLIYVADLEAAANRRRLRALFAGGVSAVWLREPGATGAALYQAAHGLRSLTRESDVALLIGDRVDVALAVDAEGVQLGFRAPPLEALRKAYAGWIGLSCHGEADLGRARDGGADHALLSPVFAVPGKGAPLGVEGFRRLREQVDLPVVALGGICSANLPALLDAGASGVAAIRALREAEDPEAAARELLLDTPRGMTSS